MLYRTQQLGIDPGQPCQGLRIQAVVLLRRLSPISRTLRACATITSCPNSPNSRLTHGEVQERYQNKGLIDGYKYSRSLPPEKQQKLRDAAKASGWNLEKDDVHELAGRAVEPMIKDIFKRQPRRLKKRLKERQPRKPLLIPNGKAIPFKRKV